MKKTLLSIAILFSLNTFSQKITEKIDVTNLQNYKNPKNLDTAFKLIYAKKSNQTDSLIYILNEQIIDPSLLNTLDPNSIESVNKFKDEASSFRSLKNQVIIKTKANYNIKPITLNELKIKYAIPKEKPVIFTLDGDIIDYDYDRYQLDENKLLTIIIDTFTNTKEKIDITLIKLLTRSKKNIEDRKKVVIRGNDSQP